MSALRHLCTASWCPGPCQNGLLRVSDNFATRKFSFESNNIGIRARQRSSGKNKRKEIDNDSGNRSKKIKGNDSGNRSKNIDRQRFRESPLCTANRRRKKITGNDSGNHSKRTEDNDSGNRSRKRSQRFRESFPEEDTNDSGFSFQEKGRPEFALIACRRKKKEAEAFYLGIEKRKQFYHSGTKGYPGFILPILFY
ncbi:hypothetical protein Tco_1428154 [Tanacetum coccineum]